MERALYLEQNDPGPILASPFAISMKLGKLITFQNLVFSLRNVRNRTSLAAWLLGLGMRPCASPTVSAQSAAAFSGEDGQGTSQWSKLLH